ncbi:MAG: hypothetical protein WD793_09960 [Steroidobacteraceae bacterium]
MFYETAVALRPNAERIAGFAIALLASLDEKQQLEILGRLDEFFDGLAESLGYERLLVRIGSECLRYTWLPRSGFANHCASDIDFVYQRSVLRHPMYRALTKILSRNRPKVAHRLIACAVVARDWDLGDYESIQKSEQLMTTIQLAVTREAARRRARQRFGGSKSPVTH